MDIKIVATNVKLLGRWIFLKNLMDLIPTIEIPISDSQRRACYPFFDPISNTHIQSNWSSPLSVRLWTKQPIGNNPKPKWN